MKNWIWWRWQHWKRCFRVVEQRAQKDNRFLRGRQIACLIYEHFRPTVSYDEIQGISGLFSMKLESGDIQDFELRWEQALLLTSDPPSDKLPSSENYGTIQSRNSEKKNTKRFTQTEKVFEIAFLANPNEWEFQDSERILKELGAVFEEKGHIPSTKRKSRESYQWKATGSCSKGESCSFPHNPPSRNLEIVQEKVENARGSGLKPANEWVRKGNEKTSSSEPKVKAQTDVTSSTSLEASLATRAKIPCAWGAKCKKSSCDFRHPPLCRKYKSESRYIWQ